MEGKGIWEGRTACAKSPGGSNEDGTLQKSHPGQNGKRAGVCEGTGAMEEVMGSRNYSP